MGIFSKSCEYAMRAVFFIAQRSAEGQKVGIKEIAVQIQSPEPFLAKILQKLGKANIIQSMKGPGGGFYFEDKALEISLLQIVLQMEGKDYLTDCAMGLPYCKEEHPCPLHAEFKVIRNRLRDILENTSVGQFNKELKEGLLRLAD